MENPVTPASRGARVPTSTCRLQLDKSSPLAAAAALVDSLDALGIGAIYASPLVVARPGSKHGYDVVDPSRLNPEPGSETDLARLAAERARREMGHALTGRGHVAARGGALALAEVLAHLPVAPLEGVG